MIIIRHEVTLPTQSGERQERDGDLASSNENHLRQIADRLPLLVLGLRVAVLAVHSLHSVQRGLAQPHVRERRNVLLELRQRSLGNRSVEKSTEALEVHKRFLSTRRCDTESGEHTCSMVVAPNMTLPMYHRLAAHAYASCAVLMPAAAAIAAYLRPAASTRSEW
jgi:hypothetical protein